MRITIKRGNKNVIPKLKLSAAADKLAKYESTGLTPEKIIEMDRLYCQKCAEVGNLYGRLSLIKSEILKILDEVDGQITDDPVSEIRERVERLL